MVIAKHEYLSHGPAAKMRRDVTNVPNVTLSREGGRARSDKPENIFSSRGTYNAGEESLYARLAFKEPRCSKVEAIPPSSADL